MRRRGRRGGFGSQEAHLHELDVRAPGESGLVSQGEEIDLPERSRVEERR
jgi:hypothetical protein